MSGQPLNVSLFGLAPNGVCRALDVTIQAVSSYLAVSPLPGTIPGGLFSVALSPGHPAFALRTILPCGVRTFLSGTGPERPCARFIEHHSAGAAKLKGESLAGSGPIVQTACVIHQNEKQRIRTGFPVDLIPDRPVADGR